MNQELNKIRDNQSKKISTNQEEVDVTGKTGGIYDWW